MNFLSISLVLFVVALNSSSACGLKFLHESKGPTTPNPNACGGANNPLIVPTSANKTVRDKAPSASNESKGRLQTRWFIRLRAPTASREAQGMTLTDFADAPSSLLQDNAPFAFGGLGGLLRGLLAPRLTDEGPINLLPSDKASSASGRAPGFLSSYFASAPNYSPIYVPSASGGVREMLPSLQAAPLATEPGYSPNELLPRDNIASAFGGVRGLLAHYYEDQLRNSLLKVLLRNLLPSAPGGAHYFGNNAPRRLFLGSDNPPVTTRRPLRSYGPNKLRELLSKVMDHKPTTPKTTFTQPVTNHNNYYRGYRFHYNIVPHRNFPRTVFRPQNAPEHKTKLSQHQPTRVHDGNTLPRSLFSPFIFNQRT